jgi:hypothetical protein
MRLGRQQLPLCTLLICCVLGTTSAARAQTCGDPDGDGLNVIDAANVLRAAVELPSACEQARKACDVNNQGGIDVIDAANVLRAAVALPADLECPAPEITDFLDDAEIEGGGEGVLTFGIAPIPQPGAPSTIGNVDGPGDAPAGETNAVTVSIDTGAAAAAANDPGLIVAVTGQDGEFVEGFFDLPLPTGSGDTQVNVTFPEGLGNEPFSLQFATRVGGVLGDYAELEQDPEPKFTTTPRATTTPTPRPTPFCGNNVIEGNEECDGTANTPCGGLPCGTNCRCTIIG